MLDVYFTFCRYSNDFKNICYPGTPPLRIRPTAEALAIKED